MINKSIRTVSTGILACLGMATFTSQATIVEFQTSLGNFKVNLHDETTPKTVENFLTYVNDGAYDDTIIHRTVDNFIVQGGGAKFEGTLPPTWLTPNASIMNEPVYSNVTATISMAKQSGKINSATSQWFINTVNNASVLDPIDAFGGGAYAVFGEVIEDGMNVVNAIADVQRCDTSYPGFRELPMPNYTSEQCTEKFVPGVENFVTIHQIVIVDSSSSTADSLSPVTNKLYKEPVSPPTGGGDSGGGSMAWFSAFALFAFGLRKLRLKK